MALLLLHVVSYAGAIFAFLFVTLSLASGLLYIAEVIEEHSKLAKSVGQRLIYAVIAAHVLFCVVDRLPWHLSLLGIVCHGVYLQNFSKTWPFISLTSLSFLASCVLVVLDHFAWFFYFADRAKDVPHHYRGQRTPYRSAWDQPRRREDEPLSFMDVATFFGFCVWLVPFFLFLSLSANDNVLPSDMAGVSTPQIKSGNSNLTIAVGAPRTSILKSILEPILSIVPARMRGNRGSRSQRDGLISPIRSEPPSPRGGGNFFGAPDAPAAGWQGYPSPPQMSPNLNQLGVVSPSVGRLSPKNSYSAFAQAASVNRQQPSYMQAPPAKRANSSPTAPSRLSQQPIAADDDDTFGPSVAEPDGMSAASSYAGSQQQGPASLTKRKVG